MKTDVGAPSVWISPDWQAHPIIHDFYGRPPTQARRDSFADVMTSPTNTLETTTLAQTSATCMASRVSREKLDSSFSTDTSDDNEEYARPSWLGHSAPVATLPTDVTWSRRRTRSIDDTSRHDLMTSHSHPTRLSRHSANVGYHRPESGTEAWNRLRQIRQEDFVPVVDAASKYPLSSPAVVQDTSDDASDGSDATSAPDKLRGKLFLALEDIDDQIDRQRDQANLALRRRIPPSCASSNALLSSLLCGGRAEEGEAEGGSGDGLSLLLDQLSVMTHNRALNQLQRHRRHVRGILQIVTAHNPDLELTERQLDSFDSAKDMLQADLKYTFLSRQVQALETIQEQRKTARQVQQSQHGAGCLESPRVRSAMLATLLEAASWYRLVQAKRSGLESESQVGKILQVLSGEEFYNEFGDAMAEPEWWDVAQAHFENIVLAKSNGRLAQWVHRMSRDVASAVQEPLDKDDDVSSTSSSSSQRPFDASPLSRLLSQWSLPSSRMRSTSVPELRPNVDLTKTRAPRWAQDPRPEFILEFVQRLTRRIRREFDVSSDSAKSLYVFVQRSVFSRVACLCFSQRALRDCLRKDKNWRKKAQELRGVSFEQLGLSSDLAMKLRSELVTSKPKGSYRVYLLQSIDAFSGMESVVPCDLLEELMRGVTALHQEAARVLGTIQIPVDTFFPLLAYVLLHAHLPLLHAQLHLIENFAIHNLNVKGEESYYVYCVHAAVEFVCSATHLVAEGNEGKSEEAEAGVSSTK